MTGPEGTDEPAPQRQHNEDRMRRARSWLARSRQEGTEEVERFVFLWIAFNAAYGDEAALQDFVEQAEARQSESHRFKRFLLAIVRNDGDRTIYNIVWQQYSGPIRVLLDNRYVFRPFWSSVWGVDKDESWERRFERDKREVNRSLVNRDTFTILTRVFDRLYTLRNQIFHGGATWPADFGRDQIRDGSRIMAALVPAILDIMQADIGQNPDSELWGKVAYPRINPEPE